MNRIYYWARVIFLGLLTAQVIATIQVYISNGELYGTLVAIKDAGYLTIPNHRMMHSLQEFWPAFFGGLFFTFSVGAALSVFSLAAAWIWDRLLSRNKVLLIGFLILWAVCLVAVNLRGFSPMVTSYFLIIPPLVFEATLRWIPAPAKRRVWLNRVVDFAPIFLLAILWAPQLDRHIFVDLRDHLLLTNPFGTKINDFYYDYNFYAAEVFKSLEQKTLKTCDLNQIKKKSILPGIEREMLHRDYLPMRRDVAVDLKMAQEGDSLVFEHRGRIILRTTVRNFFLGPGKVIEEFSLKSDKYAFFRNFTFFSLLLGFPITLYIILYALVRFTLSFFLDLRRSSVIASTLCFCIGIALLVTFYHGRGRRVEVNDLAQVLESKRWEERVAALKTIQQKGMEVADFQAYQVMRTSPHIPERYWLVKALGASRKSATYKDLLAFLDDPQPNVVSKAFHALGQRGDRRALKEIIERIETSDDWDNQWYAYKALRTLGWKQKRSR